MKLHLLGVGADVVEGVDGLLLLVVEVEFLQAEELAEKTYPVVEVPDGEFAPDLPLRTIRERKYSQILLLLNNGRAE